MCACIDRTEVQLRSVAQQHWLTYNKYSGSYIANTPANMYIDVGLFVSVNRAMNYADPLYVVAPYEFIQTIVITPFVIPNPQALVA